MALTGIALATSARNNASNTGNNSNRTNPVSIRQQERPPPGEMGYYFSHSNVHRSAGNPTISAPPLNPKSSQSSDSSYFSTNSSPTTATQPPLKRIQTPKSVLKDENTRLSQNLTSNPASFHSKPFMSSANFMTGAGGGRNQYGSANYATNYRSGGYNKNAYDSVYRSNNGNGNASAYTSKTTQEGVTVISSEPDQYRSDRSSQLAQPPIMALDIFVPTQAVVQASFPK